GPRVPPPALRAPPPPPVSAPPRGPPRMGWRSSPAPPPASTLRPTRRDALPLLMGAPPEKPHYLGHRQRLRQKLLEKGSDSLADYELLELLLGQAIPRIDVKPLAKDLLRRFESFAGVVAAAPPELLKVPGMGEAAVAALKTVR